jgi:hypothetical protein
MYIRIYSNNVDSYQYCAQICSICTRLASGDGVCERYMLGNHVFMVNEYEFKIKKISTFQISDHRDLNAANYRHSQLDQTYHYSVIIEHYSLKLKIHARNVI